MDIKHPQCKHTSGNFKMQRLYTRQGNKFVPVGWMCTECGKMQKE